MRLDFFAPLREIMHKPPWKLVNLLWVGGNILEFNDEPDPSIKFSELNKDFLPPLFKEKSKLIRRG